MSLLHTLVTLAALAALALPAKSEQQDTNQAKSKENKAQSTENNRTDAPTLAEPGQKFDLITFEDEKGKSITVYGIVGQVILSVKPDTDRAVVEELVKTTNARILSNAGPTLYLIGVSPGQESVFIRRAYRHPFVAHATPNLPMRPHDSERIK